MLKTPQKFDVFIYTCIQIHNNDMGVKHFFRLYFLPGNYELRDRHPRDVPLNEQLSAINERLFGKAWAE
jgi:hypothetical protein